MIRYPGSSGFSGPWGAAPIYNPPVPFTQQLPGGLHPGKMIFIGGVPKPNANRFTINLSIGSEPVFHFDVRINTGADKNVLVRNTKQNGSWGREERQVPYFPFIRDQFFEMIILCDSDCYKVAINNQHFLVYSHRIPPSMVDRMTVNGDITLTQLRFQ